MVQPRHEMYRPIHKALRHMLYTTSRSLGIADFRDDGVAGEAIRGLERTIMLLEAHAMHEEKHVHPQIKSKAPDVVASLEKDHQNDNKVYTELRRLSQEAGNATGDRKAVLGGAIYEKYNAFVGEYLGHMVLEEGDMQQVLWDNFTDDELGAIEGALMADVPPELMAQFLPEICGALNPDELSFMLGGLKAVAPPEMFAGVVQMAAQATPSQNWEKVKARIA
jgi:hypothetical protein